MTEKSNSIPAKFNGSGSGDTAILIPCAPDKFAEFVTGLLGKGQEISKRYMGSFSLRFNDVENFHYLIDGRIKEQQGGNLVQFQACINYSDGTSYKVSSLDDLRSYAEIGPMISIGVTLTWVYLINFTGREGPEKQQIDIDIRASMRHLSVMEMGDGFMFHAKNDRSSGMILFKINHTARTWGVDIENLLSRHIDNFLKSEEPSVKDIIRNRSKLLSVSAFVIFLLTMLPIGGLLLSLWRGSVSDKISSIESKSNDAWSSVPEKIDTLVSLILAGDISLISVLTAFFTVVSLILALFVSTYIGDRASSVHPSFVVLSRQAEADMAKKMKKYNRSWVNAAITFCLNVCAGVSGNIAFYFLW